MKWEDWNDANEPKVRGTWNLHEAFLDHEPLDYFWLASSLVSVVNQPGQGNYKAACTFLEAFCQYRHSLGLKASVLCISVIRDIGYIAGNAAALRSMKVQGFHLLGEKEFLESVEASLLSSAPGPPSSKAAAQSASDQEHVPWANDGQIVMGLRSELPLNDRNDTVNWRRDR